MEKQHEAPMKRFNKFDLLWIIIILSISLSLRLYKINTPLADWHSWRQVDTAAVARNFSEKEFNLLYPRYDDVSSNQTGEYNPEGYRFVEFPFYNSIFALMHKFLPIFPIEVYGRLTTALFSLLIIYALYYLVLHEHSRIAAMITSSTYAMFPFFVYYSRVVLPETTAIACAFLGIVFAYKWLASKGKKEIVWISLSSIGLALALLVKPTTVFYLIPILYIFFLKFRFRGIKKLTPYLYLIVVFLPFILWRMWIGQHPEGAPGFEWLITSVNTYEGQKNIFFRPAFFRWIFYERIQLLILGGVAVVLPILGIIEKPKKSLLLSVIGVAAIIYLFTFQGGNVQHDYYQTIILPALAIFAGMGGARLLRKDSASQHILVQSILFIAIVGFSWVISFYRVKDYYAYSEDLVNIGKIINTLTPQNALIVTDRDGDTTLLYLAHRKGIPSVPEPLKNLRDQHGMQYFYTDKADVAKEVRKEFTPIFENDHVFIFKL